MSIEFVSSVLYVCYIIVARWGGGGAKGCSPGYCADVNAPVYACISDTCPSAENPPPPPLVLIWGESATLLITNALVTWLVLLFTLTCSFSNCDVTLTDKYLRILPENM